MSRRLWELVATGLVLLAGATDGLHRLARSRTTQLFGRLVARVETSKRVVALTSDDRPTLGAADRI